MLPGVPNSNLSLCAVCTSFSEHSRHARTLSTQLPSPNHAVLVHTFFNFTFCMTIDSPLLILLFERVPSFLGFPRFSWSNMHRDLIRRASKQSISPPLASHWPTWNSLLCVLFPILALTPSLRFICYFIYLTFHSYFVTRVLQFGSYFSPRYRVSLIKSPMLAHLDPSLNNF